MVNLNAAQQGNRVLLDTSTEAHERLALARTVMTNPFLVKEREGAIRKANRTFKAATPSLPASSAFRYKIQT
jgi:ABC-type molybdate transport system permease subunit